MSTKFAGNFIGNTYTNNGNTTLDTFIFSNFGGDPFYVSLMNGRYDIPRKRPGMIILKSSTTGIYGLDYSTVNYSKNIYTGTAQITADGTTLTLSFAPIFTNGVIDSNTLYTFIGTKQ